MTEFEDIDRMNTAWSRLRCKASEHGQIKSKDTLKISQA